jgi:hypothetical protein
MNKLKIRYVIKEEDTQDIKTIVYPLEVLEDGIVFPHIKRNTDKFTILGKSLFTNCLSKDNDEIYVGDKVENKLGKGVIEQVKSDIVIRFTEGEYFDSCANDEQKNLPLSYVIDAVENVTILGNIFIKTNNK